MHCETSNMPHLVNLQNGEHLEIPTGESLIGRGPLLKVGHCLVIVVE